MCITPCSSLVATKHVRNVVARSVKPSDIRWRGFTLIEVIVSIVVLGTLVTMIAPLLIAVSHQRRAAERRQLAQQSVANVMERVSLYPWKKISDENLAEITLPEPARTSLRDGRLIVQVQSQHAQTDVKKVTVELRYKNQAGEFAAPVRLVAWFHRKTGGG